MGKDAPEPLEAFNSILHFEEGLLDDASHSIGYVKRLYGQAAYREYQFLNDLAKTNPAKNFRGMVINKEARVAYQYWGKTGARIDHAAAFLAVAQEMINSSKAIERIRDSSDDIATKRAKIAFEFSGAGLRLLGKVGTGLISTGALLLRADRYLSPMCWFESCQGMSNLADRLDTITAHVDKALDTVYTGDNIYALVTHTVSLIQR